MPSSSGTSCGRRAATCTPSSSSSSPGGPARSPSSAGASAGSGWRCSRCSSPPSSSASRGAGSSTTRRPTTHRSEPRRSGASPAAAAHGPVGAHRLAGAVHRAPAGRLDARRRGGRQRRSRFTVTSDRGGVLVAELTTSCTLAGAVEVTSEQPGHVATCASSATPPGHDDPHLHLPGRLRHPAPGRTGGQPPAAGRRGIVGAGLHHPRRPGRLDPARLWRPARPRRHRQMRRSLR